jgi:hypothetical protein
MFSSCDETKTLGMPVLSSVVGTSDLENALTHTPGGWKLIAAVLERTEPPNEHDNGGDGDGQPLAGEWAALLIQHLVKSVGYEQLYNGLSQIVSSDALACAAAGNAAAASDSTFFAAGSAANDASRAGRGNGGGPVVVRRGDVAKLVLVKWTWGVVLDALARVDGGGDGGVKMSVLAPQTVDFVADRCVLSSIVHVCVCVCVCVCCHAKPHVFT